MQSTVSSVEPDPDSGRAPLTKADDPLSKDANRNMVLDHGNTNVFERNYLSRMIRCDTQAAYRGTASQKDLS